MARKLMLTGTERVSAKKMRGHRVIVPGEQWNRMPGTWAQRGRVQGMSRQTRPRTWRMAAGVVAAARVGLGRPEAAGLFQLRWAALWERSREAELWARMQRGLEARRPKHGGEATGSLEASVTPATSMGLVGGACQGGSSVFKALGGDLNGEALGGGSNEEAQLQAT